MAEAVVGQMPEPLRRDAAEKDTNERALHRRPAVELLVGKRGREDLRTECTGEPVPLRDQETEAGRRMEGLTAHAPPITWCEAGVAPGEGDGDR